MGVIYRGIDTILDREVAIKAMSTELLNEGGQDTKKRFFREARAAARLQHRNIVTVFEFAEGADGVPYIVMEFLRGKNLAARIAAGPPLTLDQKLGIVEELCAGLQFAADSGVIHRDVKPANIWILDDDSVKLVDFGIAKVSTATTTGAKEIIGSAAYMSPEQAEGHPIDARSDIFSAAVVLYELVAGRRPFEASTPTAVLLKIVQESPPPIRSIAPDIPLALDMVLAKALAKRRPPRIDTRPRVSSAPRCG
jgi:serine/threonine-protein kinase